MDDVTLFRKSGTNVYTCVLLLRISDDSTMSPAFESTSPALYSVGDFRFKIEKDCSADPLTAVAVWVRFRGEPCCDDNGHQYRFYLPLGVNDTSIRDICRAFTLATHCDTLADAA